MVFAWLAGDVLACPKVHLVVIMLQYSRSLCILIARNLAHFSASFVQLLT